MEIIASSQVPIEYLYLNDTKITDVAMATISKGINGLLHLNLAGTGVTDSGLSELAKNMKSMRLLDLESCKKVTIKGIKEVAQGKYIIAKLINLRKIEEFSPNKYTLLK